MFVALSLRGGERCWFSGPLGDTVVLMWVRVTLTVTHLTLSLMHSSFNTVIPPNQQLDLEPSQSVNRGVLSCLSPFWLWVGWFWEGAVRPFLCSAPAPSPQQRQPLGGRRNNPPQTWTPWGRLKHWPLSTATTKTQQHCSVLLVVFQRLVEVVQLNSRHRADHQGVESRHSEFCRQSRSEYVLFQALRKLTFRRAQRVQEHLEISGEQKTRLNEEMWNRDTASFLTPMS